VKLFYTAGVDVSKLNKLLQGGKGGLGGSPGTPGQGGKSGPPGANLPPCLPALSSLDGQNGNACYRGKEGGLVKDGEDGVNGYSFNRLVADIPQLPGLWW
jgi:hypothetical protein